MSGQGEDLMVVNGQGSEGQQTPAQPSTIVEPDDRLAPTAAPSMPAPEFQVPVLHLHRHEHPAGTVDEEARAVVERLAGQHGEIFNYLHGEIKELQEKRVLPQFETDVTQWIGSVRGIMEGQGHVLSSLQEELKATKAEVAAARTSVDTLRRELEEYLAEMKTSLAESECQMKGHLQRLNTDLTQVSEKGEHETQYASSRIHRMEEKTLTVEVEARVERRRLQEILEDVRDRQAVLFKTVNAMEEHLGQLTGPGESQEVEGFVTPSPQRSVSSGGWPELPKSLLDDPQIGDQPECSVKDSVMSPPPKNMDPEGKAEPKDSMDIKAKVTSGEPQWTKGSVPATQFTADMHGPGVGTSGAGGPSGMAGPGVGQMKLDAPPRYAGGRRPGVRTWLAQMERYMRLMRYAPTDWIDVVAMRVDGAASSWINATLASIERNQRQRFADWDDFKAAFITAFEFVTETEEARKQLRNLRQTGRVSAYIQKFQELQCRLPGMNDEEAFSAFLSGLTPHLQEHVGAHVQGDLERAKQMALRMDMFKGGLDQGGKQGHQQQQSKGKGGQQGKKGAVNSVEAQQKNEGNQVNAVQGGQQKKGKKGFQGKQGQKKGQGGGQGDGKKNQNRPPLRCFACGGPHPLTKCDVWNQMRQKCGVGSGNA
jgi:hypothetical protein